MFSQLTDSLENTLKNLRGQGKLTEENVAESLREVRRAFLEADVNFNVTRDFVKAVKEKALEFVVASEEYQTLENGVRQNRTRSLQNSEDIQTL